ncbi:MAG: class I SAM-dependent methyltransferase [Chloroflexota bacterium]
MGLNATSVLGRVGSYARSATFGYLDSLYADTVKRRYAAQQRCLERQPGALLLDIGCHVGKNTARLAGAVGSSRVVGLEYNVSALREAAGRGIAGVVGDANFALPFRDASFDIITATDVIEHLVHPVTLVAEVYRLLRPGGYAVFATPNLASWHNVFALCVGLQPFSGPNLTSMLDGDCAIVRSLHARTRDLMPQEQESDWQSCEINRHIVVVAYRSLLRLFRQQGFRVERCSGHGYYPFPPALAGWLARVDRSHSHHLVVKVRKS